MPYDLYPSDVQMSPNNRARCRLCGKKILKDTPRLVIFGNTTLRYNFGGKTGKFTKFIKGYICHECSQERINNCIHGLREISRAYKKMTRSKKFKSALVLNAL